MANPFILEFQAAIRSEMLKILEAEIPEDLVFFRSMIKYPLGLEGEQVNQGKQIRPILMLLACHGLGGDWKSALPAAVAVELIHNFSLVHDDIQDNSPKRRGKDAVWVRYGTAQAINIGDAILSLADAATSSLNPNYEIHVATKVKEILHRATLRLTYGQYLDLAFELSDQISLDEYLQMVDGKTGAMFAAVFGSAAILAGKDPDEYMHFGLTIGRAFQIQDDWLGLWGNSDLVGKPVLADLMERKKTYPVIYAQNHSQSFLEKMRESGEITSQIAEELMHELNRLDVGVITNNAFQAEYKNAITLFEKLFPDQQRKQQLTDFLRGMFNRAT